MKKTQKAFIQHKTNGFLITFPNGNSLSTIWGNGSYTDNHDWKHPSGDFTKDYHSVIEEGSNTVETMPDCSDTVKALLDSKFPEASSGSVFGHLTFTEWLEMVNILDTHK